MKKHDERTDFLKMSEKFLELWTITGVLSQI